MEWQEKALIGLIVIGTILEIFVFRNYPLAISWFIVAYWMWLACKWRDLYYNQKKLTQDCIALLDKKE